MPTPSELSSSVLFFHFITETFAVDHNVSSVCTHTSQYPLHVGLHCVCTPAVPGLGPWALGLGPWACRPYSRVRR